MSEDIFHTESAKEHINRCAECAYFNDVDVFTWCDMQELYTRAEPDQPACRDFLDVQESIKPSKK